MITLELANRLIDATLAEAKSLHLKPLTVVVTDPGGYIVALARQDGSSNLRPAIALGKASGALALGVSSRKLAELAAERPTFIASLASLSAHGVVPAAGAVIFRRSDGGIAGAVGVTGDTSDNDERAALAGIAAAGFTVTT
jgi:uncharacterized protein GlcG (DUF336 family)